MTNTTLKPKDLPCLFESLVERDQNIHLVLCETKEKQKWHFASGEKSTERAKLLAKYCPKLLSLLNSLENYSICEKHYNQLVANNYFIEHLKKIDNSGSSSFIEENEQKESEEGNEQKKLKLTSRASKDQVQFQDEDHIKFTSELEELKNN